MILVRKYQYIESVNKSFEGYRRLFYSIFKRERLKLNNFLNKHGVSLCLFLFSKNPERTNVCFSRYKFVRIVHNET